MKKNYGLFKLLAVLLIMTVSIVMLTGCSGSDSEDTASADSAAADNTSAGSTAAEELPEVDISTLGGPGGVDVDLTKLSSTMVFAVANDMVTKPDTYMGKKIRMAGQMSVYQLDETGKTYYACLIKDAAACCAQGIEFAPGDQYAVEDYPEKGEFITVAGTYDRYEEDGYHYIILQDAVFE